MSPTSELFTVILFHHTLQLFHIPSFIHSCILKNKALGEVPSIQRFYHFLETRQAVRSFMNVAESKRLDVDERAVWLSH